MDMLSKGYGLIRSNEIGDAVAQLHTQAERCAAAGDKLNAFNLHLQAVMCAAALRYVQDHISDVHALVDDNKAKALISAIGAACAATGISTLSTICPIDKNTIGVLHVFGGSVAEATVRAIAHAQNGDDDESELPEGRH